jgi:hypothetical protein
MRASICRINKLSVSSWLPPKTAFGCKPDRVRFSLTIHTEFFCTEIKRTRDRGLGMPANACRGLSSPALSNSRSNCHN